MSPGRRGGCAVRHGLAAGGFKGAHHLQHAVALAGAQVPHMGAGAGLQGGQGAQGAQMAFGQVHHVDVVAHAGAVGRGVVVAKHGQLGQLAYGHLRDVGQQVVGNAVRVFADQAAFMGAHGVEVAQDGDAPARVCSGQVSQLLEFYCCNDLPAESAATICFTAFSTANSR